MQLYHLLQVLCVLWAIVQSTDGYCVYNDDSEGTSISIQADQVRLGSYSSSFKRTAMSAGDKGCCPYDNEDCCDRPERDATASLLITEDDGISLGPSVHISLQCGGWIVYGGNKADRRIQSYTHDGVLYDSPRAFTKAD
ncbi:hypothetical protein J3Q64DRAFT_1714457 [Phycomyces blakesleeanus]|uniref:Uncharacterized protein n=2 Tax=Phycomyces blakesleeanus TaxID=4837 RepID=A0A163BBH9_PHYB8|nr:hypothetical protein PHYBLDRAFT_58496 [Phycomyces blakesleeanus NRRL 1555(-)]OAD79451.1 hypothetical protein PHYBLDRAFT_58496 [Phycomyces blakesleeanus NRRL 1555(-)]|eukprot:XP_018297491.1 hypothetical protein PHYBLDRAFT_58496 [Phycomyces blakesleeanus NRRL 1555(-)]